MRHSIDTNRFADVGAPAVAAMADAVAGCVHCGFCLPACPTYQELGEEMDSPRGRIVLMKEALEGGIDFAAASQYVDRCLGCLACEPACPSGVPYHRLLHPFRDLARRRDPGGTFGDRVRRALVHAVLPSPTLFRLALRGARLGWRIGPVLPPSWRALLEWAGEAPRPLPPRATLPETIAAEGVRRARVGLLAGCAQQVLAPGITAAAARVLARNGVEVVIPRAQGCCGSLALHDGRLDHARALARRNLGAFPRDLDAIVTTAAGCGSGIAEYPDLFEARAIAGVGGGAGDPVAQARVIAGEGGGAGDPVAQARAAEAAAAREHAGRAVDVHVFLDGLGMTPAPPLAREVMVAYQDACHLRQARGIAAEPRRVLLAIEGVRLVELADANVCCGSAGTYNLEQPEIASSLGERKARAIVASGAAVVATGNIGCAVQLRRHLRLLGSRIPVMHTVEILDRAYRGEEGTW